MFDFISKNIFQISTFKLFTEKSIDKRFNYYLLLPKDNLSYHYYM